MCTRSSRASLIRGSVRCGQTSESRAHSVARALADDSKDARTRNRARHATGVSEAPELQPPLPPLARAPPHPPQPSVRCDRRGAAVKERLLAHARAFASCGGGGGSSARRARSNRASACQHTRAQSERGQREIGWKHSERRGCASERVAERAVERGRWDRASVAGADRMGERAALARISARRGAAVAARLCYSGRQACAVRC